MRIRTFLKPLSFIPALLLMYMIFSFSAQDGEVSSTFSYKASHIIVEAADHIFDMDMDDYQISYFAAKINGVTRKLAHMTEYFLLAIAVSFPLYVYGLHGILLMILAGGICIAFACGDEYHQSFVAGRAASMKDVGIDSIGVFIGIILVRIIGWTGRKTIFRPRKEAHEPIQSRKVPYDVPYSNGNYQEQAPSCGETQPYRQSQAYNQMQPQAYDQPYPYGQPRAYNQPQPYNQPQACNRPQSYSQPQAPQYMGKPEHSSDELSEDMPLSHLLKPKNK